jgi:multidrug/hemolysin transport system permease protein
MLTFALRCIVLYVRDKAAVCLSFLTELILVGLYALFLRKNLLASLPRLTDAGLLLDAWMLAGILGSSSLTTSIAACTVMVEDREKGVRRDFCVSSLRPWARLGGYWLAAAWISFALSLVLLLGGAGYFARRYGVRLGAGRAMQIFTGLALSAAANAAFAVLPVSFLKSGGALAGFCSVSGALIGFLTGIYLPVGTLPENIGWIVAHFPTAHAAALLRTSLLSPLLPGRLDGGGAVSLCRYLGVWYEWSGRPLGARQSAGYLAVCAACCLLAACVKESLDD